MGKKRVSNKDIPDAEHGNHLSLYGVAYGNNTFVVTGFYLFFPPAPSGVVYGPTEVTKILTSHDGVSWTRMAFKSKIERGSLTFGGGVFLGVAGHRVVISSDGISWIWKNVISSGFSPNGDYYGGYLKNATYGDNAFVIVGEKGSLVKSDPVLPALIVSLSDSEAGLVTSSDQKIDCGSDCSNAYDSGDTVTLTAVPSQGFTFTGWSGGSCSGTETCDVTISGVHIVHAKFKKIKLTTNSL